MVISYLDMAAGGGEVGNNSISHEFKKNGNRHRVKEGGKVGKGRSQDCRQPEKLRQEEKCLTR